MRDFPMIDGQLGLASASQLIQRGWTSSALQRYTRIRGQRPMPSVFSVHNGPLNTDERLMAAWLWAGPPAVLTGGWALARHGVPLPAQPVLRRFVVPDPCHGREWADAEVLHTRRALRSRTLGGLPVALIERALLDYSRGFESTASSVVAVTIAALQQRLTSPDRLARAISETRANGTAGVRRGLRDFVAGAWSVPEVVLRSLLERRRRGLEFVTNHRIVDQKGQPIGVPDAYLPEHAVAIQVHSWQYHADFDDLGLDLWAATAEADAHYAPHRIAVVPVTPTTLRDQPSSFLALLDATIRAQHGRRRPDIRLEPVESSSADLARRV